jgi:hypothetical protein
MALAIPRSSRQHSGQAELGHGADVFQRVCLGVIGLGGLYAFATNATPEQKKELDNSPDVKEEHHGDDLIYTIVFRRSEEKEITFDGKVGFNLVKFCARDRGSKHRWEETWEYRKVDDVYIPAKVQFAEYKDGDNAVLDRTVELRECSVNNPIAPTVFTYDQFGLKNGERVLDRIEGALFVYQEAKQLSVVLLLGLCVLNIGYGFDGTFRKLGDYTFVSRLLGDRNAPAADSNGGNRFKGTWAGYLPVPLPDDYVLGIDLQKRDFELGKESFLCGEWKHGGWWYYYVVCAALKVPLGNGDHGRTRSFRLQPFHHAGTLLGAGRSDHRR